MHFWVNLHAGNYFKFPASRGQQEVKGEVLQGVPRRELSHPPVFPKKKCTKSLTLKRKRITLAPQGLPGEGPLRSVRRQLLPGGNVTFPEQKKVSRSQKLEIQIATRAHRTLPAMYDAYLEDVVKKCRGATNIFPGIFYGKSKLRLNSGCAFGAPPPLLVVAVLAAFLAY